jgi:hypothetical protein
MKQSELGKSLDSTAHLIRERANIQWYWGSIQVPHSFWAVLNAG